MAIVFAGHRLSYSGPATSPNNVSQFYRASSKHGISCRDKIKDYVMASQTENNRRRANPKRIEMARGSDAEV